MNDELMPLSNEPHRRPHMPLEVQEFRGRMLPSEGLPAEPPDGSIVSYTVRLTGFTDGATKEYHYASLRAANRWYSTGGATKQSATWRELWEAVSPVLSGPMRFMLPGPEVRP